MANTVTKLPEGDEPFVVLDERDFAALDAPPPALDAAARAFLTAQGITDPATWAAFRLGAVDDATLVRFGLTGRRSPRGTGVCLPTWLPSDPAAVVGIVRVAGVQQRHAFVTVPAGISASIEVASAARVVLVDHPLTALRLHQHGASVALVENPAVLTPLASWLSDREVIVAAHRADGLATLRSALPLRHASARGVLLPPAVERMSDEMRALLGLWPKPAGEPGQPITHALLRDLHAFAQRHLASSEGQAALVALGLDQRVILDSYKPGYLPSDFRAALTDADRSALVGRPWSRSVVLPAFDDHGGVVDLLVAQVVENGHVEGTVWDQPRGLLAPTLATAFTRLAVTDSIRRIGSLFRPEAPALLLRGAADAVGNARRLAAGGVEQVEVRVRREADAIATALREVGIAIDGKANAQPTPLTVPAPMPTPVVNPVPVASAQSAPVPPTPILSIELLAHDLQRERATYRCGAGIYEVQVPWRAGSIVEAVCRNGDRQHRDPHLDIKAAPQRRRFGIAASARTGLPSAEVEVALLLIAEAIAALARSKTTPRTLPTTAPMTDAEGEAALSVLRDPRLVEKLTADFDLLGWTAEAETKELVLLGAISRLSEEPLWLALTAGADGERFPALRCLAAIMPADHIVHVSKLSDNALVNADANALRHRLLLLDDVSTVSPAVATSLRILHERGALTGSKVERDVLTGAMRTRFVTASGPVAVIAAAPAAVPGPLRRHLLEVPVDEKPEDAERSLAERRRRMASTEPTAEADRCAAHWRRVLVLLQPAAVVIPAESEVALPPLVARNRPLREAAFGLIVASAILHQHQRMRLDGAVVASPDDVARGVRLATSLAAQRASDLSAQARELMRALWSDNRTTFTMDDLGELLPTWSRWTYRVALDELRRLDCVDAGRSVRGKLRRYTLVARPTGYEHGKREVGVMAAVGGAIPPTLSVGGTDA